MPPVNVDTANSQGDNSPAVIGSRSRVTLRRQPTIIESMADRVEQNKLSKELERRNSIRAGPKRKAKKDSIMDMLDVQNSSVEEERYEKTRFFENGPLSNFHRQSKSNESSNPSSPVTPNLKNRSRASVKALPKAPKRSQPPQVRIRSSLKESRAEMKKQFWHREEPFDWNSQPTGLSSFEQLPALKRGFEITNAMKERGLLNGVLASPKRQGDSSMLSGVMSHLEKGFMNKLIKHRSDESAKKASHASSGAESTASLDSFLVRLHLPRQKQGVVSKLTKDTKKSYKSKNMGSFLAQLSVKKFEAELNS